MVAGLVAALGIAGPALAGKGGNGNGGGNGGGPSSSVSESRIALLTPGPYTLGTTVSFDTTAVGLGGGEYPMVYVECRSLIDGHVLYGQLDHPDVGFVLGGGSSPWLLAPQPAHCVAHLYAYGGKSRGSDTIRELTDPAVFDASA